MEFSFIDFLIGVTIVNAIPHFVLGVWNGRILGGLGYGNKANIAYGILNFVLGMSLFIYKYGVAAIIQNGIFLGAVTVVVLYFIFGRLLYRLFNPSDPKQKDTIQ